MNKIIYRPLGEGCDPDQDRNKAEIIGRLYDDKVYMARGLICTHKGGPCTFNLNYDLEYIDAVGESSRLWDFANSGKWYESEEECRVVETMNHRDYLITAIEENKDIRTGLDKELAKLMVELEALDGG